MAQIAKRCSAVSTLQGFQDITGHKLAQSHSRPCSEQKIRPQPELHYKPTKHTRLLNRVLCSVGKNSKLNQAGPA